MAEDSPRALDRIEIRCQGCRSRHVLTATEAAQLKKTLSLRKRPQYKCASCGADLTAVALERLDLGQRALAPVPAGRSSASLIAPVGSPEGLDTERRRSIRRFAKLQVVYRVKPPKRSRIPSPGPKMGLTTNVSEGGLELITGEPILPGPLRLTLILRRQVRIGVDAEVIWSADSAQGREYRYGVEFGEMSSETQRIWGLFMRGGFSRDDD